MKKFARLLPAIIILLIAMIVVIIDFIKGGIVAYNASKRGYSVAKEKGKELKNKGQLGYMVAKEQGKIGYQAAKERGEVGLVAAKAKSKEFQTKGEFIRLMATAKAKEEYEKLRNWWEERTNK